VSKGLHVKPKDQNAFGRREREFKLKLQLLSETAKTPFNYYRQLQRSASLKSEQSSRASVYEIFSPLAEKDGSTELAHFRRVLGYLAIDTGFEMVAAVGLEPTTYGL
jgi:hypothetical protein